MESFVYTPLPDPEIRLLELEPSQAFDANIHAHLRHVSLEDTPAYEALSYTWGDATDQRSITLGGSVCQVTKNLEIVLRYLRHQDRSRTMWIDALCINQQDNEEKTRQVQKMFQIYQSAANVICWLGESDCNSDLVMESIQDVATKLAYSDKSAAGVGEISLTRISRDDLRRIGVDVDKLDWPSFWEFFNRSYWERIWILQELIACGFFTRSKSLKGTVMCGFKSMEKYLLDIFLMHLIMIMKSPNFRDPTGFLEPDWTWARRGHTKAEQTIKVMLQVNWVRGTDLRELMKVTNLFLSSDPRDKIFALLGLANDARDTIAPDYHMSTMSVFTKVLKGWATRDGSVDFLLSNRTFKDAIEVSWIPHITGSFNTDGPWQRAGNIFAASGGLRSDVHFDEELETLTVKGIMIGQLDTVIGPASFNTEDRGTIREDSPELAFVSTELQEVWAELLAFGQSIEDADFETFWRTLVMDYDLQDPYYPVTPAPNDLGARARVLFQREPCPSEVGHVGTWKSKSLTFALPFIDNLFPSIGMRCFFKASDPLRFGLGPFYSRPGDIVAILFGARFPIVLRPVGSNSDTYIRVGDAYVQGAMNGELVQDYTSASNEERASFFTLV